VHRRVEPVRAGLEPERAEHLLAELLLPGGVEGLVEEARVDLRSLAHELREHRPDRPEDLGDLLRLHERLEVVEQRRVRRVRPLEALDVAALEIEVALERGQELREVVRRARVDPDLVPERGAADQLGAQLGRDAALLLPVAARHADEARVVRVVLERLLERAQPLEQAPHLVVDEALVGQATQRRHRLGASGMTSRRHRDLLVPAQDVQRPSEV
jgi:hypothetical protein